eukprot:COSAG01_NODE_6316_length_3740_cov_2.298270_5_plen_263_part_00
MRGLRARRRREVSLAARVGGMAARQRGREEWARRSREAALLERALRLGPSSSQAAAESSEGGKEWGDGGDEQWQGQVAQAHSAHLLRASAKLEHAGAGGAASPWPELIEETQAEDTDDPPGGGTARPRQSERVSESGLPREAVADEEKEEEEEEEEDALFLAAAMNSVTHGTGGGADGGGGTTAATAAIGFTIRQLEVCAAGWVGSPWLGACAHRDSMQWRFCVVPRWYGAGGDNGIAKIQKRREISVGFYYDRSHYLPPHP